MALKYIYLDWNVYKYLKSTRTEDRDKAGHDADLKMKSIVSKLSNRYCFPYSEGHIKDAANKYTPENRSFIEDDFCFAETINHQECIGYAYKGPQLIFITQKKPMLEFFDEYVGEMRCRISVDSDNKEPCTVYSELFVNNCLQYLTI